MTSQVEICNLALGHIGQRPITAITEQTVQAEACSRIWDSCLKETLRGHDWTFATAIIPLALITTVDYTDLGWLYVYAYPANCVAMWHLYNIATIDKGAGEPFREIYDSTLNQKIILTNTELAYGEYTFFVQDTSLFDANFVTALGYRMAADLAMALNGDTELAKGMIAVFNTTISEAERMSAYENNQTHDSTSAFVDSR